ncbi:MAG TPA: hypothetical protein VFS12_12630, partial [Terriglobia bacterium]|nr:hypothetical protein [Terriglobia bacterium]
MERNAEPAPKGRRRAAEEVTIDLHTNELPHEGGFGPITPSKENSLMPLPKLRLILLLTSLSISVHAQQYNLLIKGGQVIDPKNQINAVMDVAIADGKIAQVAANISAS